MSEHPIVTGDPGWRALDEQEAALRAEHQARTDALDRKAAASRQADLPEIAEERLKAAWQYQDAALALPRRRRDWKAENASRLLQRLQRRADELAAQVARHLQDQPAVDFPLPGLTGLADEASALRRSYDELARLADPSRKPMVTADLDPAGLLAEVLAGSLLRQPAPVVASRLEPVVTRVR